VADIGYARVSTKASRSKHRQQHPENQVARLKEAGCTKVFTDRFEGKWAHRPQWDACLAALQPGDTLVFTKLDRVGRSTKNLIDVVLDLEKRGVNIKALDQDINTATPQGKLLFHVMAALAEFESAIAQERTTEGMEAARERHGGTLPLRGPSIKPAQLDRARELLAAGQSKEEAAKAVGISRASLYRLLATSLSTPA